MWDYLTSKIAEYSIIINWLEQKITALEVRSHRELVRYLLSKIEELRTRHNRLCAIVRIRDDRLIPRALIKIHEIEYLAYVLKCFYISGLIRESEDDEFIRNLITSELQRLNLSWIRDILIRLDGPYATFLGLTTKFPIIIAPPIQAESLLQLTATYHELGHNVFSHFDDIGNELANLVAQHFARLLLEAAPMQPEMRDTRSSQILAAVGHWSVQRLNELFSDVFAAYLCGPAYYISFVDIMIKLCDKPFLVNDTHPSADARILTIHKALLQIHKDNEMVRRFHNFWDIFIENKEKPPIHDLIFAPNLLENLAEKSIELITQILTNTPRYSESVTYSPRIGRILNSDSLVSILNKGVQILLYAPDSYLEWEEKALKNLKSREPP